nr:ribonuclease H-like domain-containing protein [Tanacetum cinerariifolium]
LIKVYFDSTTTAINGLQLFSSSATDLVAYSDADWAGCPTTRRSSSGCCVFLGNNLLSWSSKRQPTLSSYSAEAEYRGVANAVAETCWSRNLLRELHTPLSSATLIYCDNVSAVYLSSNLVQHQRTKHIEIDIHFVCDLVTASQTLVLHVPSRYQYAIIFTKGLPSALFEEIRSSLRAVSSRSNYEGVGIVIGVLTVLASMKQEGNLPKIKFRFMIEGSGLDIRYAACGEFGSNNHRSITNTKQKELTY